MVYSIYIVDWDFSPIYGLESRRQDTIRRYIVNNRGLVWWSWWKTMVSKASYPSCPVAGTKCGYVAGMQMNSSFLLDSKYSNNVLIGEEDSMVNKIVLLNRIVHLGPPV